MTRPSDITRERIVKAAQRLFADHGYKDTSVRAVVTRARVNQAAINYHFGGKDGLYREVLRATIRALTEHQLARAEEMKGNTRENALAEFIKYQLRPLAARDELSRHFRIFDWEAVRPTLPEPPSRRETRQAEARSFHTPRAFEALCYGERSRGAPGISQSVGPVDINTETDPVTHRNHDIPVPLHSVIRRRAICTGGVVIVGLPTLKSRFFRPIFLPFFILSTSPE